MCVSVCVCVCVCVCACVRLCVVCEHPGGEPASLTFAGKDASEELNVVHPPDVVGKCAAADVEVDTVAAVREPVQQRGVASPQGWAQVAVRPGGSEVLSMNSELQVAGEDEGRITGLQGTSEVLSINTE